jgi:hypothetical protein
MQLSLQTFPQLLQRMSSAVQRSSGRLFDLSAGSVLRALLESNASIALWIQWLIVQTLGMTRAGTSVGTDLDTWMADFSLIRQPSVAAQGIATFSRLSSVGMAVIPAGTQVKSRGATQIFSVIGDPRHSTWQANSSTYQVPSGVQSVDLPIVAVTPGASGNITADIVSLISTPIVGIDFVSNKDALSGGMDAESDPQFRTRFRDYLASRSQATFSAISFAIADIKQGVRYKIFENSDVDGSWSPGQFLIIVDDGTGTLATSLLSAVYAAVDAVRPIGSRFIVMPPSLVRVAVDVGFAQTGGQLPSSNTANIEIALEHYIHHLSIGSTLSITRIAEVTYGTANGRQNIISIAINGAAVDLACSSHSVFRVESITVQ